MGQDLQHWFQVIKINKKFVLVESLDINEKMLLTPKGGFVKKLSVHSEKTHKR